jgi:RNA polymerase sigma-70 factor (ECF subfamily)
VRLGADEDDHGAHVEDAAPSGVAVLDGDPLEVAVSVELADDVTEQDLDPGVAVDAIAEVAGHGALDDEQDRSLWNREQIGAGSALVERALSSRRFGPYTLQAAIAAVHAEAPSAAATDWAQIVGLYDVLARADPSPVVALNRAVAVAMRDGPEAGLVLIDAILARGDLVDYRFAHSARADLLRRLGRMAEARVSYERALALTSQEPERRFLARRLAQLFS